MTGTPQTTPPPQTSAAGAPSRGTILLLGCALLLAVFAAYSDSFSGPFIYDDQPAVIDNSTLREWWKIGTVLTPPGGGATVSGRPMLNLSFAVNYALDGAEVRGYHLGNVLIHALAALTLFGLVRRTLLLPAVRERFRGVALPAAFTVAAVWGLHPLDTEAVTYVAQRAESLMSLFYLLTLYTFVRSVQSTESRAWQAASFVACLFGMATKENMVSAPIIVLLFDRALVAGSFVEAWRQRGRYYAVLTSTWILLGALVLSTGGNRGGSAGFDVGIAWRDYALTQFPAIVTYLQLAFWPHPLAFDYGTFFIHDIAAVWWQACVVTALVGVTLYALWRRPMLGLLGALFFAILAPTSIMPGTTQMIVEHRMYLPLVPLVALVVAEIGLIGGRRGLLLPLALAVGLGYLTYQRNADYRTETAIWRDTVIKRPDNPVAQAALGGALAKAGHTAEAIEADRIALKLRPDFVTALCNLGSAMNESRRPAEARPLLEKALRIQPNYALGHIALGVTFDLLKQYATAREHYEIAVRLKPDDASAQNDLGDSLSRAGKAVEGIAHLREALRLNPNYSDAHYNLAAALARVGRLAEAQGHFETGFRLSPGDATAFSSWGNVLLATNHAAEAVRPFAAAARLKPADAESHFNYGTVLAAVGRYDDALHEYEEAVRLRPDYAEAHNNFGNTLLTLNRETEAIVHYERSLELKPVNPSAHNNLGLALARTGHLPEAAAHFAEAVRLAPGYQDAMDNLTRAQAGLQNAAGKN